MLKAAELAKAAGVSVSTIHYYIVEGLLTPPTKTARNMAYYDPGCVQEIRHIQEMQSKRYLPLSVIKLLIRSEKEGQASQHIDEIQSLMENLFRPLNHQSMPVTMNRFELQAASELSETDIKHLEEMQLVQPSRTPGGPIYNDIDLSIAQIYRNLKKYGVQQADLNILPRYIALMKEEMHAMHETIHRLPEHESVPIDELFRLTTELKGLLMLRIGRQEASHKDKNQSGEKA